MITGLPAGYEEEASVCIKYLSLGLESECKTEDKPMGSLHSSLTQPPRGLLVHGASGIGKHSTFVLTICCLFTMTTLTIVFLVIGKSRFVNHLITASQFSRCTTISIGSDILLKK